MIRIGAREIGTHIRPYLIAEMSGNHNRSFERAVRIIEAAAASGADAIKLQTFTADTMTIQCDATGFIIEDTDSLWAGRRLYDLYGEAATPYEWHGPLMERARSLGLQILSTPFDETAVDFLETLDFPAYKIASFECTDLRLIRKIASTGKPLIISTGMASLAEVDEAVQAARAAGGREIVLLKCTSTYPATPEHTNIRTIGALRDIFGTEVGLSDHTMGSGVAVAAVSFGATVIEKHFTSSRAEGGVDSAFSLEPHEFALLRVETERAWQSLGQVHFGATRAERKSLQFRRSLYVVADISAGERLTPENVRAIRPGYGLPPKHFDEVMGCTVRKPIKRGTPLSWSLLK